MGGQTRKKHGSGTKKRTVSRRAMIKHRGKDLDRIQDELKGLETDGPKKPRPAEYDEDLPGGGLHYCRECDRHFVAEAIKLQHVRTKAHKRRVKELRDTPYSQAEADAAAGMGKADH